MYTVNICICILDTRAYCCNGLMVAIVCFDGDGGGGIRRRAGELMEQGAVEGGGGRMNHGVAGELIAFNERDFVVVGKQCARLKPHAV